MPNRFDRAIAWTLIKMVHIRVCGNWIVTGTGGYAPHTRAGVSQVVRYRTTSDLRTKHGKVQESLHELIKTIRLVTSSSVIRVIHAISTESMATNTSLLWIDVEVGRVAKFGDLEGGNSSNAFRKHTPATIPSAVPSNPSRVVASSSGKSTSCSSSCIAGHVVVV